MAAYSYFNGCDGTGADCDNANCDTAFHQPNDTHIQVPCQVDNVSGRPCAMTRVWRLESGMLTFLPHLGGLGDHVLRLNWEEEEYSKSGDG